MISIATNLLNLKIQQCITSADNRAATTLQRLSTGYRINSAKDNAAGLYIGTQFSCQESGTQQAYDNVQNGINIMRTADDALGNMGDLMSKVRELSLKSANGVYSDADRASMQQEADSLIKEMRNIETSTSYSGRSIFAQTGGISGGDNPNHKNLQKIEAEYAAEKAAGNLVIIENRAQLEAITETEGDEDKVYVLMNDIDLAGKLWTPLGHTYSTPFSGTIDGNGYTIDNLTMVNKGSGYTGFIGYSLGTVKNLAMTNVNIDARGTVGAIAGRSDQGATFTNCYVTGKVVGSENEVGGIVGNALNNFTMTNCYSTADVKGRNNVGGLIGNASRPIMESCYSTGSVTGASNVGGLIGQVSNPGSSIKNSYANGFVKGTGTSIGGFIGSMPASFQMSGNHWSSESSGQSKAFGTNNVVNDAQLKNETSSFFTKSSNLKFLGDGYDYDYNPPQLNLFVPPPPRGMRLQVGADAGNDNALYIDCAFTLGNFSVDFSSSKSASDSINKIDGMAKKINDKRSFFGSYENRLSLAGDLLLTRKQNYSSSESTIMDTDIASASSELTKEQILRDVSASLITQTMQIQKNLVLSLI